LEQNGTYPENNKDKIDNDKVTHLHVQKVMNEFVNVNVNLRTLEYVIYFR